MKYLQWLGAFVLMLVSYILFGVVFADLWRFVFVPAGLPAIVPEQAIVGWLMFGLLVKTQRSDKEPADFAIDAFVRVFVILATWGTAHLLMWVTP